MAAVDDPAAELAATAWHALPDGDAVLAKLGTSKDGLDAAEVAARQKT
jgi:hypothetical protein